MSETQTLGRIPLNDYAELLGAGEIEELRALAKPLRSRSIQMVNSTAVGGGVAEILNRLMPLAEELELNMKWEVMSGGEDFFEVTKAFHNALHGAPYHASQKDFDVFLNYNQMNRERLPLDAEFVVIHDPQPAAIIEAR
jgi:trehalose synthase